MNVACIIPKYSADPETDDLRISVLGQVAITARGVAVGKLPKKAVALVAYLAAHHGMALGRAHLSDLLWPEQSTDQARHSLRNCLLDLRRVTAIREHLVADFESVQIRDIDLDLEWFERLAESGRREDLRAAADLYRGEFLFGTAIKSDPFEEWLAGMRERLRDAAKSLLRRLASAEGDAGDFDAALSAARRLVALDPLCDVGQRALMLAHAQAGNRAGAVLQYRGFSHLLRRELGVAPAPETQALMREISSGFDRALPLSVDRKSERLLDEIIARA